MQATLLAYYSLGSASILSTGALTVLNGLCYATLKPSSPSSTAFDLAILGLHGICCIELVILTLLLGNDIKPGLSQCKRWKVRIYCCICAFLFTSAAVTAGATTWRNIQSIMGPSQPLLIAQCIMWAVSIFNQGLFCGFLLVVVTKQGQGHRSDWMTPEPESFQDSSITKSKREPLLSSVDHDHNPELQPLSRNLTATQDGFVPVRSFAVDIGSQVSNRFSGRTLFQRDSAHSSFDSVSPESPSSRVQSDTRKESRNNGNNSQKRKLKRPPSEIKRSLDSLILQPSPERSSPTAPSSTNTDPQKPVSTKSTTTSEHHIHPLFRSGSASPPPTPGPGTIVTASPVAGQTISVEMLSRVRTASIHGNSNGTRCKSPLGEWVDSLEDFLQDPVSPTPGSRRSGSVHERKYDLKRDELNESPHES